MTHSYTFPPKKTIKKNRFSDVFRGDRNGKLTWNGLINTATGNIHETVARIDTTCTI